MTQIRWIDDTVHQKYKCNTTGKSPTELQKELQEKGVKGFVVSVNARHVKMLVDRGDIKSNREVMQ